MKILLLNFSESPENFHFEQAFTRCANKHRGHTLHIVHNFKNDYTFLKTAEIGKGWRKRFSEFAPGEIQGYDLAVSIDAPWRKDKSAVFYAGTLKNAGGRKILAFNHLLPERGQSPFYDLLKTGGYFKVFDEVYFLEFDDPSNFPELKPAAERLRNYCIDPVYYSPAPGPAKRGDRPSIFTAGSKGRDFETLFAAIRSLDLGLDIITNSKVKIPAGLKHRVRARGLNENLDKIKKSVQDSSFVVVPVGNDVVNPTAGMAVAYMAMAAQKPVIARSTGWMRKYLRHGHSGYLYSDFSAASLKALIEQVLADRGDWARIGSNARKAILKNASLDTLAGRILGGSRNR